MKTIATTILFSILFALPVIADTGYETHDKELLFRANGINNIGLSNFDGGLGVRYFLSSRIAVRPGFSYYDRTQNDVPYGEQVTGNKREDTSHRIDVVLEYHLEPRGRLASYWGLGAEFGQSEQTTTYALYDTMNPGQRLRATSETSQFSILGVLGVQWEATESIHLGAEYQLSYSMSDQDQVQEEYEMPIRRSGSESSAFSANSTSIYAAIRF